MRSNVQEIIEANSTTATKIRVNENYEYEMYSVKGGYQLPNGSFKYNYGWKVVHPLNHLETSRAIVARDNLVLKEITSARRGIRETELDLLAQDLGIPLDYVKDIVRVLIHRGQLLIMTEKENSMYRWLVPKNTNPERLKACENRFLSV